MVVACGEIAHSTGCVSGGNIGHVECCPAAVIEGLVFGPRAGGLDLFGFELGAAYQHIYQHGSGGGGGGSGDIGGDAIDIHDDPDDPWIDGDADMGGGGTDLPDDPEGPPFTGNGDGQFDWWIILA